MVNGGAINYRELATGIGWLCWASARISCEFYVYLKRGPVDASSFNYIGGGATSSARDAWAGEYFRGPVKADSEGRGTRLQYLMDVRAVYNALYGSAPTIIPIFGATDKHLKSAQPGDSDANDIVAIRMLDRLFYAFRNHSGYGSLMFGSNGGGAGSWKWELPGQEGQDNDPTLGQPTTGSRDLEMALSYSHYCQPPYNASSRKGVVL